jgi:ABC-2 type transport system permease protein
MQGINWIGAYTLYKREVWRFVKVLNQTILAPMITTLLFLAILSLAMGGMNRTIDGIPYNQFIAPGLIMMAVVQNAFANTSSSLMLSKIQGVIVDILMPPLTGAEITFSLVMGGVTRGLMVGISVTFAIWVFVPLEVQHWGLALFYLVFSSMMLALLGVLGGLWAQSFDGIAAVTNYIVTPLAFLSGTFYSVKQLPDFWHTLSHYNPFFYMIDGIRYAFTGYADGSIETGMIVLLIINLLLWLLANTLITRGYRLKS